MSFSPTTKAPKKEFKLNKEDNFSPFLGLIGQKEELPRWTSYPNLKWSCVWFEKKYYQATHISNKADL